MPVVNARSYAFVFSLNKQANIRTAIANANLKYMRSLRSFAPMLGEPTNITDSQWYGKGHSFPTFVDPISRIYRVPASERSATSLEALFCAAMVMGKVETSGSSGAGWQHTITFQSIATNTDVIYTTFGEAMGSEYKKVLGGAYVSQFTLTGNRADHVTLSWEGAGRKYADGTFDVPATISPASFYKTLYGTCSFGDSGALADISAEVLSWTVTCNQNPQPMFLMGNSAGEEMDLSRVLIGRQSVTAQAVIMVNVAHRNRFLNATQVGLTLVAKSPDLAAVGVQHALSITLPNCKIATEAFGTEGDTVSYTLNFGEEGVLKLAAEPCTMVFTTNIDASELLVAA